MKRLGYFSVLFLGFSAGLFAQAKTRVAILNFDYGTVQSSVASIFGTNQDIGKGIADMLVDRFVQGAVYSVIERKALDKIMAEQNFSNSDRANSNTAAKLGRILGVDAIVIGSITQFGRDDKSTNVSGGGFGGIASRYGIGGVGRKESKAVVGITARIINVETAEILASATGLGQSQRSGTNLIGGGGGGFSGGGGGLDMRSSNFGATILGEATNNAVTDVARQLERSAGSLPAHVVRLEGLVADASGDTLILNIGSKAGVKVGDRLQVTRPIRQVRDPATGKVIRNIEDKLGEVVITDVDESSSTGRYSGSPAKVGDAVKN
jgi:curli biogenesis system outer membrane secretion channel CsgG